MKYAYRYHECKILEPGLYDPSKEAAEIVEEKCLFGDCCL